MPSLPIPTVSCCAILSILAAQELPPTTGPVPVAKAELIAVAAELWQCEPLRCSLAVTAKDGDALVRAADPKGNDPLAPWEVERFRDERWEPVRLETNEREHPARRLTSSRGRQVTPSDGFVFELELWHLDVVAQPGRIRARCLLEQRDAQNEQAPFVPLSTEWLEIEIKAHEANAARLLGEQAAELRAAYEKLERAFQTTTTVAMHRGPHNFGPGMNNFVAHVATAERLLAEPSLSARLRARARLVLAFVAVTSAKKARNAERNMLLQKAHAQLEAEEMVDDSAKGGLEPLPSGGLGVVRQMLVACVDGLEGRGDPEAAHRTLCEKHPFFAMWWKLEAVEILKTRN